MGFTHVELLPVMEHPFYGSWGYQVTGYFAPTARYGTPQDFMYFVDHLHRRGIGVILDWVPSHFPSDEHGLAYFDGTHLYEHADPRQGFHPEWNSAIFNYGRAEVRNFLASSALFWLDTYHIDALRVDAVASMLYLDYGRRAGEWIPNRFGGNENLDARGVPQAAEPRRLPRPSRHADHRRGIHRLADGLAADLPRRPGLRAQVEHGLDARHPRSTCRPIRCSASSSRTSSPSASGTPSARTSCCRSRTTRWCTARARCIGKMPGDEWQQFASLRLLFGYMWTHPGKKLLFMGGEFGQKREWQHDESLEWHVLQYPLHEGVRRWVRDLNRVYRATPALYQRDFTPDGFQWIDCNNADQSVHRLPAQGEAPGEVALIACNFTPVPRDNYRVGVPRGGWWRERLNSDAAEYGGSGIGNFGAVEASPLPSHGMTHSLALRLPPLAAVVLTPD